MNKKLIITEQQYKNLKFFLLESTFDEMAKQVVKKGDTITITTQGKKFNFEVVDNNSGLILMDVSDKNSDYFGRRAFLSFTSFNDNKLELNLASEKQKEETPPQVKTWSKWILKDVDQIDVFRDGKIVDGTNYDPNGEENKKRKSRFIEAISTLNEGDRIILETSGKVEEIYLDYIGKTSDSIQFELGEDSEDDLGNFNISSIEMSTDENDINISKEGLITVKIITYESKDGNMNKNESKIQNIRDFVVTNAEDKNDDEELEDGEEESEDGEDGEEEWLKLDNKLITDLIANDPKLKLAMLNFAGKMTPSKKASFFNEFKTGEKGPDSAGWIKVKNILTQYADDEVVEKFGDNFLKNRKIFFEPLDEVEIDYDFKGQTKSFRLEKNKLYRYENSVYFNGIDTLDSEYNLRLENNQYNFEIIVKDTTEIPNVFICDVVKLYKVKTTDNKTITERTEPQQNVKMRFIDSPGYKAEKN